MSDATPVSGQQGMITSTFTPFDASQTARESPSTTPLQSPGGTTSAPSLTVIIIAVSASLLALAIIITVTFKLLQRRRKLKGRRPSKIEEGGGGAAEHGLDTPNGLLNVDGNIRNSDIPLSSPMPLLGVDSHGYSYRDSNNTNSDGTTNWQAQVLVGGVLEDPKPRVVSAPLLVPSEQRRHLHSGSFSFSIRSGGAPGSKRRTCPEPLDLKPLSKPVRAQSVETKASNKPRPRTVDIKPLPKTPTASERSISIRNGVKSMIDSVRDAETGHFSWQTNDDNTGMVVPMYIESILDTEEEGHENDDQQEQTQNSATIVPDTSTTYAEEPESPVLGVCAGEMNIVKAPETPKTPRRSLSEMRTAMNEHLERERGRELRELTQKLQGNHR